LTFVDSLNMPYGFLTSDSGIVHDLTNEIEFYGNVKFFTPEGETLFADSLRWDPKDELVKTGSSVRLVRGGEYIEANGMETDIKMDRIRFLGRVRGRKREGG
ncbi:MAG: LPS export ABC transporter periplasmic protein LptC, partial [bacterium]